jgi:hypothetical protein
MEIIQAVVRSSSSCGSALPVSRRNLIAPLKLSTCTACPHDRPLAEALEVLKANFGPGLLEAGKRSSPDRGDSPHRDNPERDGIAAATGGR